MAVHGLGGVHAVGGGFYDDGGGQGEGEGGGLLGLAALHKNRLLLTLLQLLFQVGHFVLQTKETCSNRN